MSKRKQVKEKWTGYFRDVKGKRERGNRRTGEGDCRREGGRHGR